MSWEGISPEKVHHTILDPYVKQRKTSLLSVGSVRLQFLFDIKKFSTKVIIIVLVSIFMGTYNFFILERTGLYSLGIGSIFQSIARCVSYFMKNNGNEAAAKATHTFLFWGMSLAMNVPLAIFGYRNIGKKFAILTIINICVSSLTSMAWSSLPSSWGLREFYIFSDPRTFNTQLINKGINILQWNYVTVIDSSNNGVVKAAATVVHSANQIDMNDSSRVVLIFFYGIVLGLLHTISSIFILSLGGSTGGIDWIVYYLVKKKSLSSPNLYLYMGLVISFLAYVCGTYVPYAHYMLANKANGVAETFNNQNHSVISSLLGPMYIATVISALTKKIMFYLFYSHFKIINVKIFTNKIMEFKKELLNSEFPHGFTISSAVGGYGLRHQFVFEVTCFALDLKMLRELVSKVDPGCLLIAIPVKSLNGKFVLRETIS
ncbi:YitT family protein [Candidatus Mycoplasma haematohominis]|uniref:YitT family protein n=1 Tax=Candidatus Mycoplasma haematohominis TaxID=1494318 RepID=UPI001C0A6F6F|nr:YitT family protein [Candidatus Mycoplasma haemohominis]